MGDTEGRATRNEAAGIMTKQDWYAVEGLIHKYDGDRKAISEGDFEIVMALLKKGALERGRDNTKQAAHFGTIAGILSSVDMSDPQKRVVVATMHDAFRQPDTPQDLIKFFVLMIMKSVKDDSLVQDALPYANGKDGPTRTMARQYLESVGYKI